MTTALQSSKQELTPPLLSQDNPLELRMTLPTVTSESRQVSVKAAQTLGQKAQEALQAARGVHQKSLQAMTSKSPGLRDDVRRAKDLMEKAILKGRGEIDRLVAESKKFLEKG